MVFWCSDWHILSPEEVKAIAAHAPMSVEELKALRLIGDKKVEEYGARIVKAIKIYVEREKLEAELVKRPAKRPRTASAAGKKPAPSSTVIEIKDDDDEFDNGIDYASIDLDALAKSA
jgi:ribonuclease D